MTAEAKQFSPELIHLLGGVLADPDSVFHRLSHMRPAILFDKPISVGTPFLSKVERHILSRHRAEVARLLYEGCMLTLQGPVARTRTIFPKKVVDESSWKRDVRKVFRESGDKMPAEREELRNVDKGGCLGSGAATLALNLLPTDEARAAQAACLQMEGKLEEAKAVATKLAEGTPSPTWYGVACSRLGTIAWERDDPQRALFWYRESARSKLPDRLAPVLWFLNAVRVGAPEEGKEAAQVCVRTESRVLPVLKEFVDMISKESPGWEWLRTSLGAQILRDGERTSASILGELVRGIL